jgi:hypothetical protein
MLIRHRFGNLLEQTIEPIHVRTEPAVRRTCRATSAAGCWIWRFFGRRPIVFSLILGASAALGSLVFRGRERTCEDLKALASEVKEFLTISPTVGHSLARIDQGQHGYFVPVIRYPVKLVDTVKRAHRDRQEILTSFETLHTAWRVCGGEEQLTIQFIIPPSFDPYTGGSAPAFQSFRAAIDETNFRERLPLLKEIYTLIVEGDGSGKGRLAISNYDAEPTTDGADPTNPVAEGELVPKEDRGSDGQTP